MQRPGGAIDMEGVLTQFHGEDPARIVIADDLPANNDLLDRLLTRDGYVVFRASDGDETLALVEREQPDLVILDVMMPRRSGFDICAILKSDPATRLIPVVLVTALNDSPDKIRGLDAGADDFLSKPVNPAELRARVRSLLRLKRYTDDLDSADATILSLALTVEARDPSTDGHCRRLSAYAVEFGMSLGMSPEHIEDLRRGGVLHDIGKVGVPDAVLLKPGRLTPDEFRIMQDHTIIGDRLCSTLRSLKRIRPIVRHHHERLDGSGYPDHLRADRIPLLAQIIGIVDVFDALTTARPYKAAQSLDEACEELAADAARGWRRADLVDHFIGLVRHGALPLERH